MRTPTPATEAPRAVAREALALAREALPSSTSARSRRDFTAHRRFAVLALKALSKTDGRGVAQVRTDLSDLRNELWLDKVPH